MKKLQILLAALIAMAALSALPAWADDLVSAATRGDLAAVKAFIAGGADVNAKNNSGDTALEDAAAYGYDDIVQTLLAHGADANAKNNTSNMALALAWAALEGHDDVVKTLLAHGADVNAKNSSGDTALTDAAYYHDDVVVQTLLAHGADASAAIQHLSGNLRAIALIKKAQQEQATARFVDTMLRQTRNPRLALARLMARFRQDPRNETLRQAVIRVALKVRPAPVIPHAARRALAQGVVLFREAKSPQDFQSASDAFQKAADLAPWWPDPYFNLAKTQEQTGNNHAAVGNFRNYLAAAPTARDRGTVRTELYQAEFLAKQEDAASASRAQRQQNAQTILAYLQSHFGGKITEEESCRGYPIINGTNFRCTKDEAAGANWVNLTTLMRESNNASDRFHYSITGPNADMIKMDGWSDFCGKVGSSTSLDTIRWTDCGPTGNTKATVSFYTENQQGQPFVEANYLCTSVPGNPAETDWCVREQFILQKE